MNVYGTLYGIGIGPGDPEFITLKGLKHLQQAPIIAFPAGRGDRPGVAERIIQPWILPHQQQLPLYFPYVQDPDQLQQAWQAAAAQVWSFLAQGQDVAFASEGDVSFYSTFSYLSQTLQALHPQVNVETIPGICSPLAAAATLGLPLTWGQQRLAVIPALYQVAELEAVLGWADVVVLMKVSSVYEQVWQLLNQYELLDQSYGIDRCGWPDQQVYRNLRAYPQLQLSYFSLLIVQVTDQTSRVSGGSPR